MDAEPPALNRKRPSLTAVQLCLVLAVALATFSGALGSGFVWDDFLFISENPALRDLGNIPKFFVSGDAVGTYVTNPYYRPLVTASFAADFAMWGNSPAGFHATNLLLHLGVCALLFFAAKRLTAQPVAAFAAAMLFAVHPANAEPVAYVSARADLFCALFMLASLLFYLRDLEQGSRGNRFLSSSAYLLALLSKITAGILPVVLVIHLFLIARKGDRWTKMVPYAVITLLYLAARNLFAGVGLWEDIPIAGRVAAAGPFIMTYVKNALLPINLRVFYDLPMKSSFADLSVILSWGAIAVFLAGFVVLVKRGVLPVAFGVAWFFAGLLPVSGIVITLFPTYIADRYLYIPLVGLAFAFAGLVDRLSEMIPSSRMRACAATIAAVCTVALALTTVTRLRDWRDSLSLWTAAGTRAPDSAYVLNNLGTALRNAGRLDEAESALDRAISIDDRNAGPHINLAGVAFARKNVGTAEKCVLRALELEPENPVAMNLMGVVQANRGRFEDARACFSEALRIYPGYPGALANMNRLVQVTNIGGGRSVAVD